jgi:hypothetical protein
VTVVEQIDGVIVVEQEPDVIIEVVLYVDTEVVVVVVVTGGGQVDGVTVVEQEPDVIVDTLVVIVVKGVHVVDTGQKLGQEYGLVWVVVLLQQPIVVVKFP